jgi:hypothetical protein
MVLNLAYFLNFSIAKFHAKFHAKFTVPKIRHCKKRMEIRNLEFGFLAEKI